MFVRVRSCERDGCMQQVNLSDCDHLFESATMDGHTPHKPETSLSFLSRVHQCTRFRSPSLPDSHSPPCFPPLPDLKSLPGQAGLRFGRWVLQRLVPFHSPIWPRAPFPQEAPKRSASTSFQYGLLTRSQMQAGKLRPIIGSQSWPRSHTCSA